ncbi:MAG: AAA family ATPase [Acidobacteria bacterium]|nr:AAA family ATPase [Acidobacteriota bacterium]
MSLASIFNPFHSSVVSDPWEAPETDITSVHQYAFSRCCEAVAAIRARPHATSVLLYGQPGSGKTHLLARLRARVARDAQANGSGGMQEAIFVSVRLHTSARMIWRHLRDCLVGDLLRHSSSGGPQLERLLLSLLSKHGLINGDGHLWLAEKSQEARLETLRCHELEGLFDLIDGEGRLSYNLRAVLGHLLFGRHRGLAAAWLRGASLPETALQRLEIAPEQDGDDELEELAHQLVIALSSLATAELPLIFCFDQIEALQLDPQDASGLIAFGQMISALQAETRHTLLISCVQAVLHGALGQFVRAADLDRIKEFGEFSLYPLTWEEAQQLIKARMDALPELKGLRATHLDSLWPLRESEIRTVFIGASCIARRLITHCAALFEAQRGGAAVAIPASPTVEVFLNQALEERRRKALDSSEPSQTNQIITHGLPSLLWLTGARWRQQSQNVPVGVDMLFEGPAGSVAIGVCNNRPGPGLVKKLDQLRKLAEDAPETRLIMLRDSRLPIGPTAIKTRETRELLLQKGARWVEPSAEALAALDALRRLLSDAKSGELHNRGDTVELKTVQDWLMQNLSVELKDILNEVLPGDVIPPPEELYEEIAELLGRLHMLSVTDVAALLGREDDEVGACAQRHSERIGVLGDPPTVLFRLVTEGFAA